MGIKTRILVVDNDPQVLQLITEVLAQMGTDVECAKSGLQAAALIEKEKYDGFFLDWTAPEISGAELVAGIRKSRSNSTCPIVILTGTNDRTVLKECFRLGVNLFLYKPITHRHVRSLLNASRGLMTATRRQFQRKDLDVSVTCRWQQKQIPGRCVDLSTSGMLVELEEPVPPEADVELLFTLPDDPQPLQLSAQLARTTPGNYFGFQFTSLSGAAYIRLMDFSEKL